MNEQTNNFYLVKNVLKYEILLVGTLTLLHDLLNFIIFINFNFFN